MRSSVHKILIKALLAAALLIGSSQSMLAEDGLGDLQREAAASAEGFGSNVLWFTALFASLVAIGLWTSLSRLNDVGPSAKNLFLALRFQLSSAGANQEGAAKDQASPDLMAHLRSIDLRHVSFVSHVKVQRGARVRLDLASLPDYPKYSDAASLHLVEANVVAVKSLGGNPENFLTRVRLPRLSRDLRAPLRDYVETLAHHGRWSQA